MPTSQALGRGLFALLTASLALVSLAPPASAAPGDLDPSFGGDGKIITNFSPGLDEGNDVAIQADGKIVVAGGASGRFAVARYEMNGSLDDSFSGDGKVKTNFTPSIDGANDVAIQADGRIVAAGSADGDSPPRGPFALVRYEADGQPGRFLRRRRQADHELQRRLRRGVGRGSP